MGESEDKVNYKHYVVSLLLSDTNHGTKNINCDTRKNEETKYKWITPDSGNRSLGLDATLWGEGGLEGINGPWGYESGEGWPGGWGLSQECVQNSTE